MVPDLNVNKQRRQYNATATHFAEIVYLKQTQEDMLSLVFKKLNVCLVMPASRGVNPLATSHTAEHLKSICLHTWSHYKPILYLISYCLNKRHCLEPRITINKRFSNTAKKSYLVQALSWKCNITRYELKVYAAPSRGSKIHLCYTMLEPCYYLHQEFGQDLIS